MRFQILTAKILFRFFMPTILQWNIRGLQANTEELDLFSFNLDPTVICPQETFLKENKNTKFNFKYFFSCHRHASEANGIVHGGSSVLVKPSTPHRQIKLQTDLRPLLFVLLWVKPSPYVPFTFPATMVFNSTGLENLIAQLPPPSYCLGTLTPTVPYGVALKLIFKER